MFPTLRFSQFSKPWSSRPLAEAINSLDAGVSVLSEDVPISKDQVGVLKTSCVSGGWFDASRNKLVNLPSEINRLKQPVTKNTIIISRMNTPALVGLSGLVSEDIPSLFLPDRLWAAKVSDGACSPFIAYLLSHGRTKASLSARATGTSGSMKNITKSDVLTLPVNLPTERNEQQKIADFLTSVDTRIQQLKQKQSLLQQYKKGLMQQLFSQTLRFKDDAGHSFPDWEERSLGEVGELVTGLTYSPSDIAEDGLLVLRSSNIQKSKLSLNDNVYVDVDVSNKALIREGDILICVRNGSKRLIGKNALIPAKAPYATHGAFMTVFRTQESNFVHQLLQSDLYKWNVHRNLGATINSINGADLKKFKFMFPSPEEQTKIANALAAMDKKIDAVGQQIEHTQIFKKGMLQQMFV